MRLILASASPRRSALLAAAGFTFDIRPVEVDETPVAGEDPSEYVSRLAMQKARSVVWPEGGDAVVVAADTTVLVAGEIMGKPVDERDARRMLNALSGREHEVLTGVAVRHGGREVSGVELSRVRFIPLDAAEIGWYVASGEPFDKAGAYAVQGLAARFVERVEGSYSNVVGLPVSRVYRMLKEVVGQEGVRAFTRAPRLMSPIPASD